jgi:hypothetical protein
MVVFAFQASELSPSKEPSRSIWFQSVNIRVGGALQKGVFYQPSGGSVALIWFRLDD